MHRNKILQKESTSKASNMSSKLKKSNEVHKGQIKGHIENDFALTLKAIRPYRPKRSLQCHIFANI